MGRFGQHYKVNVGYIQNMEEGDYNCVILSAKEQESRSGKPMVAIELNVANNGLIRYFLVDDRSDALKSMLSDIRITRFFDCFDIRRGLFNFNAWVGKKGLVHIGKGKPDKQGYVYLEVKKLYTKEEAKMIISGDAESGIPQNERRLGRDDEPIEEEVESYEELDNIAEDIF